MSVSILAKLVSCPYTYLSNLPCISLKLICKAGDEIFLRSIIPLLSWQPSRMFNLSMWASLSSLSVRMCSFLRSEKSACTSPSVWSSLTLVKKPRSTYTASQFCSYLRTSVLTIFENSSSRYTRYSRQSSDTSRSNIECCRICLIGGLSSKHWRLRLNLSLSWSGACKNTHWHRWSGDEKCW